MKQRLGDICDIIKGETGIMKAIPGSFPMVTLGEINKTHNNFQFDAKAVIVPLVSSTGHGHASMKRVKYQEGKFALGNILCAVIPKDERVLLAKYLHIFLHWNREELLVSQMKGMANVSLSMNKIADVEVTIPSIDRQIYIVDLEKQLVAKELAAEKILSDQLAQTEIFIQAILQDGVQGKLVKQNPKEGSANELLKRIKVEKGKLGNIRKTLPPIKREEIPFKIPEGWIWCRLGELTNLITSGSRDWAKYYSNSGPIFVRMGNLSGDNFNLRMNNVQYVTLPKNKEGKRTRLEEDDILISITGEVGNLGLIPKDFGEAYINQHTALVRFEKIINARFMAYLFLSEMMKKQFNAPQRGMKNSFRLSDIEYLVTPLPPCTEQKRIVAEMEKQFAQTKQLKECVIANQFAAKQLLNALLHEALEGKVVSQIQKQNTKITWSQDQKFWQRQLVAIYVKALREQPEDMSQGEMGIAKYTYLADKIVGANSGFHYLEHNWGPYTLEINECLTNGEDVFVKKQVGVKGYEVFDLGKGANHFIDKENSELQRVRQGFQTIVDAFKPFPKKERTRQLELVASICWLVEKLQTVNFPPLLEGMRNWKTPKRKAKNKAELFSNEEVSKAIQFIKNQQWHFKLLKDPISVY